MLFNCYKCSSLNFTVTCRNCGEELIDENIPIETELYPEFQYNSQGMLKDLFVKRRAEKLLTSKLEIVLTKYKEFEKPYFVNFVHYLGRDKKYKEDEDKSSDYSSLYIFQSVLIHLGFDELTEYPQLTMKLVRSTQFRFDYQDFIQRAMRHVGDDLRSTLVSWIGETGSSFRTTLPMLLYYFWKEGKFTNEIHFSENAPPLLSDTAYTSLREFCETLYFAILVGRFKLTLEHFDPSKFITMHAIDRMNGYDFEDFLAIMLSTIGFQIEKTKRSNDQGADLFAERFGKKIVIQAKNYFDSVGNSAIQQVISAKTFYECDEAIVITNSFFTKSAKLLAESAQVKLIDRLGLQIYLEDYNQLIMNNDELIAN